MSDAPNKPVISLSPAYDLLQSLSLLAQSQKKGRWKIWAEQVEQQIAREEVTLWQDIRRWFRGSFPLGNVGTPLIPLLPPPASIEELLHALAILPIADFLRIIVTMSPTNPDTPLDNESLLSLSINPHKARAFTDTHLRFTGQERTHVLKVLAHPEVARSELISVLQRYYELIFVQIEPELQEERSLAATRLQEILRESSTTLPGFVHQTYELEGFTPVVLAPSAILDRGVRGYIHEIKRSLLDSITYEPLILMVGTREALGTAPPKRRVSVSSTTTSDPAEHWADVYSALADPSRLRMLHLLAQRPHYQQELAAALQMTGATISHHLLPLTRLGLVRMERQAHRTYLVLQTEAFTAFLQESQRYVLGTQSETEHLS